MRDGHPGRALQEHIVVEQLEDRHDYVRRAARHRAMRRHLVSWKAKGTIHALDRAERRHSSEPAAGIHCLPCVVPWRVRSRPDLALATASFLRRGRVRMGDGPTLMHGTAVAFGSAGLLITGRAGVGKSSLALELMALGATLVADDQVVLTRRPEGLLMSAPATLDGKIEARGIGIMTCDAAPAWLRVVVDMDHVEARRLPEPMEIAVSGEHVRLIRRVEAPAFASMLYILLRGGLE